MKRKRRNIKRFGASTNDKQNNRKQKHSYSLIYEGRFVGILAERQETLKDFLALNVL
jgi:hypothetical protein